MLRMTGLSRTTDEIEQGVFYPPLWGVTGNQRFVLPPIFRSLGGKCDLIYPPFFEVWGVNVFIYPPFGGSWGVNLIHLSPLGKMKQVATGGFPLNLEPKTRIFQRKGTRNLKIFRLRRA